MFVFTISAGLILFSKNLALYILASITKSHRLYSRIKPTWVPSLLLKVPTAQAVEILKKMKAEYVYHVLQNKKGLLLLMKLPVSESVKILKKMEGLQIYHILRNEKGLSLFMKLPISESVKILKEIGVEERICILLSKDLERDPQYSSFLRSIPPSLIEECQYSMPIGKRQQFVRYMYNLGIKISLLNGNKTTEDPKNIELSDRTICATPDEFVAIALRGPCEVRIASQSLLKCRKALADVFRNKGFSGSQMTDLFWQHLVAFCPFCRETLDGSKIGDLAFRSAIGPDRITTLTSSAQGLALAISKGDPCPCCGSKEMLLFWIPLESPELLRRMREIGAMIPEDLRPAAPMEGDKSALKEYWQDLARTWWCQNPHRRDAI